MKQTRIPAVFMRGGTSKGLMFQQAHLPEDRREWDRIFLRALGSPDPYGRQLDGMGGGISSLSKVCIVGPSTHPDADVDYTFAQILVKEALVEYSALCGNMSSAVGPFAVDEGMVKATGKQITVRIHNTNTKKIIASTFGIDDGQAAVDGELVIPGVDGPGAPVSLEFLDPGGATTGKLLPTGVMCELLEVPGMGQVEVSMIDASNACVFVKASTLGLTGTEMPDAIDANRHLMEQLSAIRLAASVKMGVAANETEARRKTAVPFVGFVAEAKDATTLSGAAIPAGAVDLIARVISNGQPHRALPLGVSSCLAVAANIPGSVVNQVCRKERKGNDVRLSMPSGVLTVTAEVESRDGVLRAVKGGFFRTQRRLFEGSVLIRSGN
jgi:2-methylaconitate cis-trans-isomerase PrpF